MANWKCAAEIWAVNGADLDYPRSILKETSAEIEETGESLLVTYEASGTVEEAAQLMSDLFRRCYVMICWGAVSPRKLGWATFVEGDSWGPDSGSLPKSKRVAWGNLYEELLRNERVPNALFGED